MLNYQTKPAFKYYNYDSNGCIYEISREPMAIASGGGCYCPVFEATYYDKDVTETDRKRIVLKGEPKLQTIKRYVRNNDSTITLKTINFPTEVYTVDGRKVLKTDIFGNGEASWLPYVSVENVENVVVYDDDLRIVSKTTGECIYYFDYLITDSDKIDTAHKRFTYTPRGDEATNTNFASKIKLEIETYVRDNLNVRLQDDVMNIFKKTCSYKNVSGGISAAEQEQVIGYGKDDFKIYGKLWRTILIDQMDAFAQNKIEEAKKFQETDDTTTVKTEQKHEEGSMSLDGGDFYVKLIVPSASIVGGAGGGAATPSIG